MLTGNNEKVEGDKYGPVVHINFILKNESKLRNKGRLTTYYARILHGFSDVILTGALAFELIDRSRSREEFLMSSPDYFAILRKCLDLLAVSVPRTGGPSPI